MLRQSPAVPQHRASRHCSVVLGAPLGGSWSSSSCASPGCGRQLGLGKGEPPALQTVMVTESVLSSCPTDSCRPARVFRGVLVWEASLRGTPAEPCCGRIAGTVTCCPALSLPTCSTVLLKHRRKRVHPCWMLCFGPENTSWHPVLPRKNMCGLWQFKNYLHYKSL